MVQCALFSLQYLNIITFPFLHGREIAMAIHSLFGGILSLLEVAVCLAKSSTVSNLIAFQGCCLK